MAKKKQYKKPLVKEYLLSCDLPVLAGSTGMPSGPGDGGDL